MLKRRTIGGRQATVAYLDGFTPVAEDKATNIKIRFDDGDVVFARLVDETRQLTPAAAQATIWNPEKVLFEHMGGRTPPEADYAAALKTIAEAKGIAI